MKGALAFFAVSLLALAATLMMPRHYSSEARLLVRFGRENRVDPTAAGGPVVSPNGSPESEIHLLMVFFKSRAILDRVVNELGPEFVLHGQGISRQAAAFSRSHQNAVRELERSVSISAPGKSNIITVAARARSPEAAQRIVATLVAVCLDEHLRMPGPPGKYDFVQEQTRVSHDAWKAAAERLREAKNRLGVATIDGQRREAEMQLSDTAARLMSNRSDLVATEGKITGLKEQIARLPEKVAVHQIETPGASLAERRQSLYQLERQQQELAAKMNDAHPKLAAVRQQIADLRAILDAPPADRPVRAEAHSPARQTLELSLSTEESRADALRAQEQSLVKQQSELRFELAALRTKASEVEQLQQQVAVAEHKHSESAQRLEQARMNRSLGETQFSLSVAQPASYVAQASGPPAMLVLALGMVLAAGSMLGTMVLAAWRNPVIRTAEQLARLLDLPLAGNLA